MSITITSQDAEYNENLFLNTIKYPKHSLTKFSNANRTATHNKRETKMNKIVAHDTET